MDDVSCKAQYLNDQLNERMPVLNEDQQKPLLNSLRFLLQAANFKPTPAVLWGGGIFGTTLCLVSHAAIANCNS